MTDMTSAATDAGAPFGRTPKGQPYKSAAAAKRARTMAGHAHKPVKRVPSAAADAEAAVPDDLLARHARERAARMLELRPFVDEHERLSAALVALNAP